VAVGLSCRFWYPYLEFGAMLADSRSKGIWLAAQRILVAYIEDGLMIPAMCAVCGGALPRPVIPLFGMKVPIFMSSV
jgi:hypothetical protein